MTDALTICQNAASLAGIDEPSFLIGNPDPLARGFRVSFDHAGKALARMKNGWGGTWSHLQREFILTTVAQQETYALPGDWLGLVDGTVWDRSTYTDARGALSPQEWQTVRSGLVGSTGLTPRYRIRGGTGRGRIIALDPVPGDGGETLVLEYLSSHWIHDEGRVETRDGIEADSDEPVFDSDLMELDVEWRVRKSRGLPFAGELGEFEMERDKRFGLDTNARVIDLGGRSAFARYQYPNVPESGFGL